MAKKKRKVRRLSCRCHTVFSAEYGKTAHAIECDCVDQYGSHVVIAEDVSLMQTRKKRR